MAQESNPLKVVLGTHRLTYVHLKEPAVFKDDKGVEGEKFYDTTFLIPKDHPDVAKIKAAIKAAYDANKESLFKGLPLTSPKLWNPLRDGEEWLEEHPEASEYEDMYFLKAKSKSQPGVFDSDKQDIIDLDEVYSGCFGRGVIVCYAFNNKSKGFGFYINSVMKIKDGERLGGFAANADDYDEEEDEPKTKKTAPKAAGPKPKSNREFAEDQDGNAIYSDDGGTNWYYVE